jgi:outer membrane murein-binding lipoprotein Lpp
MIKTTVSLLLLCGLLSGCGSSTGGSATDTTDESANSTPSTEANAQQHMLSDQQRTLENAQSAAAAMEESNRAKQQALEEAQQ